MDVKMPGKKDYVAPTLIVHGDVEKITQQSGNTYWDNPSGTGPSDGPATTGSSY